MIAATTQQIRRFIDPSLLYKVFLVGSMTVGVKIVAFAKELVVAHRFGTSDEIDAFLIALLIPTLVAFVVGDTFRDALIPAYAERRIHNRDEALKLVSNVLWICTAALIGTSLLAIVFSDPLIHLVASNFDETKLARTRELLFLVIPFGIAFGIARVLQAYLQANDQFGLSSAAPVIIPASTIAVLFLFPGVKSGALLASSVAGGAALLVVILMLAMNRKAGRRVLQKPGWDVSTNSALGQAIPLMAGAIVMEGCFFIDTMMAASLSPGSVAVLSYGERICKFVLSIGGTAAGFVLFPHVSDLAARKDWPALGQVVFRFSFLIFAVSIPAVGLFWFYAEPVVRLLLERGEFVAEDTARVADVLRFAGFQIPGYILAILATKVVMALRGGRFLLITTLISLLINIGLNIAFISLFGVKGIALSTAVVGAFTALTLFSYFIIRLLRLGRESEAA